MKRNELNQLFRKYVIEHEEQNILSREYVIEHGTEFDDKLCWSYECEGMICDQEGVPFSGLLFEVYENGNLVYFAFYENGLRNGIDVKFFPSGKIKGYGIFLKGRLVGKSYEWYENGMIKEVTDHYQNDHHYKYIEFDKQGKIIKQGKV